MAQTSTQHLYVFGNYCLDTRRRLLLREGDPVPLTPKAFETLCVLVQRSGHVVSKGELLDVVWSDTFVEEATLSQNIFTLRKALGQGNNGQQFIETIPKHGYRFLPSVREMEEDSSEVVFKKLTRTHIIAEDLEDTDPSAKNTGETLQPKTARETPETSQDSALVRQSEGAPSGPSNLSLRQAMRRYRQPLLVTALSAALLAVCALAIFFYLKPAKQEQATMPQPTPSRQMQISKMTHQGKAMWAAVSPDGKYIAYASSEAGKQSLRVQQVTATNSIEIVAPAAVLYKGVSFSPDSGSIYYVAYPEKSPIGMLYKVPILGGTPKKIIEDIDSPITFSPDARQFAFIRLDPDSHESALIVANADGTGERKLVTHARANFFSPEGPAWSPDGKVIVCSLVNGDMTPHRTSLVEIRVEDGAERLITEHLWNLVGQITWLPDGSGLVLTAWDSDISPLSNQIWMVSYANGQATRVIADFNHYQGVSLTAAGDAVITVQTSRTVNFWVAPFGEIEKAVQITTGMGDNFSELLGMSWTPDNKIVYGSAASGNIDLWIMNNDGSNQKQLTVEAKPDLMPSVSPNGRTIVFTSGRTGAGHIWRMDVDGNNLKQLTNGVAETFADISPDGRWVVYTSVEQGMPTLWKISIDGGEPVKLSNSIMSLPSISPDGKYIACFYRPSVTSLAQIAVVPFDGGEPVKIFDGPSGTAQRNGLHRSGIHWTPDGRALTYANTEEGVSNIWLQSMDGGSPRPLTDFKSEQIFRFGWSPDGKQLAFERGVEFNDVVLISKFR